MLVAIGSTNGAKIRAVEQVIASFKLDKATPGGPGVKCVGVKVASGVSDQPMTDDECIVGAENRARAALAAVEGAEYGIGMEGGVHKVGDKWFQSGWTVVVDKHGKTGVGSSARVQLSAGIIAGIHAGEELAVVIDRMSGLKDVRSNQGVMGILTGTLLNRDLCYTHGIIFAFAPWLSDAKFWT